MTSKDSAFRAQLHAAIDKSDAGNWTNALQELDRLVAAYPNEVQARFERAMVHLNLNCDAAASADLEQVLSRAGYLLRAVRGEAAGEMDVLFGTIPTESKGVAGSGPTA